MVTHDCCEMIMSFKSHTRTDRVFKNTKAVSRCRSDELVWSPGRVLQVRGMSTSKDDHMFKATDNDGNHSSLYVNVDGQVNIVRAYSPYWLNWFLQIQKQTSPEGIGL